MRDDLNASEKRLIAALDRIDQFIDRAAERRGGPDGIMPEEGLAAQLHETRGENRRLSQELAALHERQSETLAACEARLAEAHRRLVDAGQEAARLAAANEALAEANRALIDGAGPPGDEIRRALEAEIESLRAARAAELAQMGDIIDTLDRLTAPAAAGAQPAGAAEAAAPDEGAGFEDENADLDEERG
ncbi:hypothetical protein [Paracoccus sp. TOH]|uniref:ATPase n=1 Tax=Paracoccus simplex TaxID=2086346 RepID=A0ABV7S504_9RHOB|nr:hypothetical protein [Paracoccus sp. TOH]WJS86066.1 hypothetical protein NBE95_11705 [Paracoccus sp. TOH]